MKLDIPLILQEKDSIDCWPACISMIMNYYGKPKSIEDITKDISVYEGVWTYAPQLWIYLLEQDFEVNIITLNPHIFSIHHRNDDQATIYKHITTLHTDQKKEKIRESLKYFKKFMERWWLVIPNIPTKEDIIQEISQGRPLIALLTSNFLSTDEFKFNFHFNTITWVENNIIYVNDPDDSIWWRIQSYQINDFLYWIYASAFGDWDNSCVITIKEK